MAESVENAVVTYQNGGGTALSGSYDGTSPQTGPDVGRCELNALASMYGTFSDGIDTHAALSTLPKPSITPTHVRHLHFCPLYHESGSYHSNANEPASTLAKSQSVMAFNQKPERVQELGLKTEVNLVDPSLLFSHVGKLPPIPSDMSLLAPQTRPCQMCGCTCFRTRAASLSDESPAQERRAHAAINGDNDVSPALNSRLVRRRPSDGDKLSPTTPSASQRTLPPFEFVIDALGAALLANSLRPGDAMWMLALLQLREPPQQSPMALVRNYHPTKMTIPLIVQYHQVIHLSSQLEGRNHGSVSVSVSSTTSSNSSSSISLPPLHPPTVQGQQLQLNRALQLQSLATLLQQTIHFAFQIDQLPRLPPPKELPPASALGRPLVSPVFPGILRGILPPEITTKFPVFGNNARHIALQHIHRFSTINIAHLRAEAARSAYMLAQSRAPPFTFPGPNGVEVTKLLVRCPVALRAATLAAYACDTEVMVQGLYPLNFRVLDPIASPLPSASSHLLALPLALGMEPSEIVARLRLDGYAPTRAMLTAIELMAVSAPCCYPPTDDIALAAVVARTTAKMDQSAHPEVEAAYVRSLASDVAAALWTLLESPGTLFGSIVTADQEGPHDPDIRLIAASLVSTTLSDYKSLLHHVLNSPPQHTQLAQISPAGSQMQSPYIPSSTSGLLSLAGSPSQHSQKHPNQMIGSPPLVSSPHGSKGLHTNMFAPVGPISPYSPPLGPQGPGWSAILAAKLLSLNLHTILNSSSPGENATESTSLTNSLGAFSTGIASYFVAQAIATARALALVSLVRNNLAAATNDTYRVDKNNGNPTVKEFVINQENLTPVSDAIERSVVFLGNGSDVPLNSLTSAVQASTYAISTPNWNTPSAATTTLSGIGTTTSSVSSLSLASPSNNTSRGSGFMKGPQPQSPKQLYELASNSNASSSSAGTPTYSTAAESTQARLMQAGSNVKGPAQGNISNVSQSGTTRDQRTVSIGSRNVGNQSPQPSSYNGSTNRSPAHRSGKSYDINVDSTASEDSWHHTHQGRREHAPSFSISSASPQVPNSYTSQPISAKVEVQIPLQHYSAQKLVMRWNQFGELQHTTQTYDTLYNACMCMELPDEASLTSSVWVCACGLLEARLKPFFEPADHVSVAIGLSAQLDHAASEHVGFHSPKLASYEYSDEVLPAFAVDPMDPRLQQPVTLTHSEMKHRKPFIPNAAATLAWTDTQSLFAVIRDDSYVQAITSKRRRPSTIQMPYYSPLTGRPVSALSVLSASSRDSTVSEGNVNQNRQPLAPPPFPPPPPPQSQVTAIPLGVIPVGAAPLLLPPAPKGDLDSSSSLFAQRSTEITPAPDVVFTQSTGGQASVARVPPQPSLQQVQSLVNTMMADSLATRIGAQGALGIATELKTYHFASYAMNPHFTPAVRQHHLEGFITWSTNRLLSYLHALQKPVHNHSSSFSVSGASNASSGLGSLNAINANQPTSHPTGPTHRREQSSGSLYDVSAFEPGLRSPSTGLPTRPTTPAHKPQPHTPRTRPLSPRAVPPLGQNQIASPVPTEMVDFASAMLFPSPLRRQNSSVSVSSNGTTYSQPPIVSVTHAGNTSPAGSATANTYSTVQVLLPGILHPGFALNAGGQGDRLSSMIPPTLRLASLSQLSVASLIDVPTGFELPSCSAAPIFVHALRASIIMRSRIPAVYITASQVLPSQQTVMGPSRTEECSMQLAAPPLQVLLPFNQILSRLRFKQTKLAIYHQDLMPFARAQTHILVPGLLSDADFRKRQRVRLQECIRIADSLRIKARKERRMAHHQARAASQAASVHPRGDVGALPASSPGPHEALSRDRIVHPTPQSRLRSLTPTMMHELANAAANAFINSAGRITPSAIIPDQTEESWQETASVPHRSISRPTKLILEEESIVSKTHKESMTSAEDHFTEGGTEDWVNGDSSASEYWPQDVEMESEDESQTTLPNANDETSGTSDSDSALSTAKKRSQWGQSKAKFSVLESEVASDEEETPSHSKPMNDYDAGGDGVGEGITAPINYRTLDFASAQDQAMQRSANAQSELSTSYATLSVIGARDELHATKKDTIIPIISQHWCAWGASCPLAAPTEPALLWMRTWLPPNPYPNASSLFQKLNDYISRSPITGDLVDIIHAAMTESDVIYRTFSSHTLPRFAQLQVPLPVPASVLEVHMGPMGFEADGGFHHQRISQDELVQLSKVVRKSFSLTTGPSIGSRYHQTTDSGPRSRSVRQLVPGNSADDLLYVFPSSCLARDHVLAGDWTTASLEAQLREPVRGGVRAASYSFAMLAMNPALAPVLESQEVPVVICPFQLAAAAFAVQATLSAALAEGPASPSTASSSATVISSADTETVKPVEAPPGLRPIHLLSSGVQMAPPPLPMPLPPPPTTQVCIKKRRCTEYLTYLHQRLQNKYHKKHKNLVYRVTIQKCIRKAKFTRVYLGRDPVTGDDFVIKCALLELQALFGPDGKLVYQRESRPGDATPNPHATLNSALSNASYTARSDSIVSPSSHRVQSSTAMRIHEFEPTTPTSQQLPPIQVPVSPLPPNASAASQQTAAPAPNLQISARIREIVIATLVHHPCIVSALGVIVLPALPPSLQPLLSAGIFPTSGSSRPEVDRKRLEHAVEVAGRIMETAYQSATNLVEGRSGARAVSHHSPQPMPQSPHHHAQNTVMGGPQLNPSRSTPGEAEQSFLSPPPSPMFSQSIKVVDRIYLVFERIPRGSIVSGDRIDPLPLPLVWSYFRDLLSALAYLHANRIVHGDIKPENLLDMGNGHCKLADFGLAKRLGPLPSDALLPTSQNQSTPAFMCPELVCDHLYNAYAHDIWSAGVTLYNLVYGTSPFAASVPYRTYELIRFLEPPMPEPIEPALRDLMEGLLAKDPSQRFTLRQAINHPWVTANGAAPVPTVPHCPASGVTPSDYTVLTLPDIFYRVTPNMRAPLKARSRRKALRHLFNVPSPCPTTVAWWVQRCGRIPDAPLLRPLLPNDMGLSVKNLPLPESLYLEDLLVDQLESQFHPSQPNPLPTDPIRIPPLELSEQSVSRSIQEPSRTKSPSRELASSPSAIPLTHGLNPLAETRLPPHNVEVRSLPGERQQLHANDSFAASNHTPQSLSIKPSGSEGSNLPPLATMPLESSKSSSSAQVASTAAAAPPTEVSIPHPALSRRSASPFMAVTPHDSSSSARLSGSTVVSTGSLITPTHVPAFTSEAFTTRASPNIRGISTTFRKSSFNTEVSGDTSDDTNVVAATTTSGRRSEAAPPEAVLTKKSVTVVPPIPTLGPKNASDASAQPKLVLLGSQRISIRVQPNNIPNSNINPLPPNAK